MIEAKDYKLVLGLEVHLHVKTKNKMFCYCTADTWGKEPNTCTCPTCLGLPGALPVPNFEAIQKTQLLGLALNCSLRQDSIFDRKHYFYPDLPKGYQISQYKQPLCENGSLTLNSEFSVDVERVHLEEDVAKSFHEKNRTLLDFNKSGVPLVEIVTRPVFKNVDNAVEFCKKVQNIVRFLGIGEVDMEKGQMRLEANISMRTPDMEERNELPKYKVEIKNINSFKFFEKAVKAEIKRQSELLSEGKEVLQENRGFDEASGVTVPQREKEEAEDYRYFPEPDIPPMFFDDKYISETKKLLPKLPEQYKKEFISSYGISENTAKVLVDGFGIEYVKVFLQLIEKGLEPIKTANFLVNKKDLQEKIHDFEFLYNFISKEVTPVLPENLISESIKKVLEDNKKAVEDYKNGKENALQFLVGLVMRDTKGQADPKVILSEMKERIVE